MKSNFYKFSISILFICFCLQMNSQKAIDTADLMNLKSVSDPQISPDGKWVAYLTTEMDLKKDESQSQLWMISIEGGPAIPMTSKDFYSPNSPRWSPDNKYLSFLASKKNEKTQLYTLNRLGGDAEQITNIKQGIQGYEWSPDGKTFLLSIKDAKPEELTEDKKDDEKPKPIVIDRLQFKRDYVGYLDRFRVHLYSLNIGDSIPSQLTFGDFDDLNPTWNPNGSQIAFQSNRTENPDGNSNTDIWIVSSKNSSDDKNLIQVTTNSNSDTNPVWSKDGKTILYNTITDAKAMWYATQKLAMVSATGGEPKILANELDRNISKARFSDDGKSIFFIIEENGTSVLGSLDRSGKNLKRIIKGNFSISDYDLVGSSIVPLLTKSNEPAEVYNYEKGKLIKLSTVNDKLIENISKPTVEKITFKSKDGTPVEGFVVKPINFIATKKYPLILWLHGGPVSQYEFGFNDEAELFAANGYITLLINPRGSSGYGQPFSEALFADWGNKDFQDVMAGVNYIIDQGYTDENRLGVGGWSYGGILTNYVITKSDRFKAAISGASEALYRANYGHDHYQLTWELELGLPWENAKAWEKISPFNDVAKIITPTLWVGGSDDWNVPILNSEQMYQAMKRLGRETQLVVYPGEHHGLRRPSFIKDRYERYTTWFNKYLK
ncbi:S9 family peptidase [Aureibaculum algae]|nr:S9 family peptidase [Aureibaculum algae]